MSGTFELGNVSPAVIDGNITSVALLDLDGVPNRVIESNAGFRVNVNWTISDPGTTLSFLLGGTFTVRAFVESMGPGPEIEVGPPVNIAYTLGTKGLAPTPHVDFGISILVPPNTLLGDNPPASSGLYKLTVLITHSNFGVQTIMTGFAESVLFEVRVP